MRTCITYIYMCIYYCFITLIILLIHFIFTDLYSLCELHRNETRPPSAPSKSVALRTGALCDITRGRLSLQTKRQTGGEMTEELTLPLGVRRPVERKAK